MNKTEETTTEGKPLRRIPALVDDTGMCVIKRASMLRLATIACTDVDSPELLGEAIVWIARWYLETEAIRLKDERG